MGLVPCLPFRSNSTIFLAPADYRSSSRAARAVGSTASNLRTRMLITVLHRACGKLLVCISFELGPININWIPVTFFLSYGRGCRLLNSLELIGLRKTSTGIIGAILMICVAIQSLSEGLFDVIFRSSDHTFFFNALTKIGITKWT